MEIGPTWHFHQHVNRPSARASKERFGNAGCLSGASIEQFRCNPHANRARE
jgi:hypothetical protein